MMEFFAAFTDMQIMLTALLATFVFGIIANIERLFWEGSIFGLLQIASFVIFIVHALKIIW